jgi:hypothetical protein
MSVITSGKTFANGEQLSADKLNLMLTGATFSNSAVDLTSTLVDSNGAIVVRDGGITPSKLSTGAPSWGTDGTLRPQGDILLDNGNADGAGLFLASTGHSTFFIDNYLGNFRVVQDVTERMRLTSDGRLLVGTTASNPSSSYNPSSPNGVSILNNKIEVSRTGGAPLDINRAESGTIAIIRQAGTLVGSISVTSSATSYNTSSDYRLKEEIIEMDDSLERLKALKPCNFAWKADGTRVDGFIAHEAQEVVPEAVTGTKDAVDDEGNPDYQGIDQSKLVPLLTKALQEAVAKIESLEARVTELES